MAGWSASRRGRDVFAELGDIPERQFRNVSATGVFVWALLGSSELGASGHTRSSTESFARSEFGFDAGFLLTYTTNLFHEQSSRLDDFDSFDAAGQRYAGVEGPGDFSGRVSLGASHTWRRSASAQTKIWADLRFTAYQRNYEADYFTLRSGVDHKFGKRETLSISSLVIPRRFKRNYVIRELVIGKVYEPAFYTDFEQSFRYLRRWSRLWRTDLEYVLGIRRFLDPFKNRDRDRHELALMVGLAAFKAFRLWLGGAVALASTPDGKEFGVNIDRSYLDGMPRARIELDLPVVKTEIDIEGEYIFRKYTTDVAEDEDHFRRKDQRYAVELAVKQPLNTSIALVAEGGWTQNFTSKQTATTYDDELGYTEGFATVGFEGEF